jgi:DNA-binding MarR family transcriptional regulator
MFREDLSRNFGFILNDVARLLRTAFDRRVKSLGLTRSQWWVLNHLFRNDGVTQSELADLLEVEKATLGRLLDRLEQKGWIRREADATDRRVRRVSLTDEVEPALKAMRAAAADLRRDALAGLSPEDQARFVDALLAVKSNLSRPEAGAGGNGAGRNGIGKDGAARSNGAGKSTPRKIAFGKARAARSAAGKNGAGRKAR